MILSLFNLALFVFLLRYGYNIRHRSTEGENSRLLFWFTEIFAVMAFGTAFVSMESAGTNWTDFSFSINVGTPVIALFFARIAAIASVLSIVPLIFFALGFPYPKKWGKIPAIPFLILGLISVVIVFSGGYFSTQEYVLSFGDTGGSKALENLSKIIIFGLDTSHLEIGNAIVFAGPFYFVFNLGIAFSLSAISIIIFVRRFFIKSKIYRLQLGVSSFALILAGALWFLLSIVLPGQFDLLWTFNFLPVVPLGLVLAFSYAMGITRIFALREVLKTTLTFIVYALVVGVATGATIAFIWDPLASVSSLLAAFLVFLVFVVAALLAYFLRNKLKAVMRSGSDYGDELEEKLTDIDFSLGRDEVIDNLLSLLKEYVDCTAVNLFVVDSNDRMQNIGSTNNLEASFNHRTPAIDFLINNDVSIAIKTEVITNYTYHEVKTELLGIMSSFDADILILLREGRTIIGAITLGAKRTGTEFTSYDFSVASKLYGKLFVVAYYFKNVAQESLVVTVDRELEFSDQIIFSIQENIDRVEHPTVDLSFMTRSARKLGGDFLDFIRISKNRYIIIIGDVSGKGLNASMSMVILKSVIRTFLRETKDFKKLIIKINDFIKVNLPRGTFFAGVIGIMDFETRTFFYVNCGIPAMFLLSSSYNNPVEIQGDGKILGFAKNMEPLINVRKAVFKTGDIVMMTTDGLTDAESIRGARFGKERIQASILENREQNAERMVRFLYDSVEEFIQQEIADDITIMAIKFI